MFLEVSHRYRGLYCLVSDSNGNLYLLRHFRYNRTVHFKKLKPFMNGNHKAIKYHGSNISFRQLKSLAYNVNETIDV